MWIVPAVVTSMLAGCAPGAGDYVSPRVDDPMDGALRGRVEELKRALARGPTTADNFAERADVLWDWANAYALDGGVLPMRLPTLVATLGMSVTDGSEPNPAFLEELDRYIEELTIKDERPDALGRVEFASSEPVVAGTWSTVEQIWTVGSMPVQPGAAVQVGRQPMTDHGLLQNQDSARDNFVSVRASRARARFERSEPPVRGARGRRRAAATLAFRLEGAALETGDTVTVTFGDTSGGSRGFKMQTGSSDRLKLPLYLDLEGTGNFLTPVLPGLVVVGGAVHSVRTVVPSVVAVGEVFELAVRSQDRFHNRATGAIPAYQVLLNGQPFASIEGGDDAISVLKDLAIDEPGVYRFTVRTEDGSIRAESNPIWVHDHPAYRIYWGETHGHTDFAEGQGSPERYFRYGRDDARLDFLTLPEHDFYMDASEWRTLQRLTRSYHEEGRFVTFLGYEWTVIRLRGGHHNVLFRNPNRDLVGIHLANTLPELYRLLAEENEPDDVVVIPHAHQAADWTRSDPELERLVEIYSMHGSFEWFGNFYLRNGFEVGFISASDDHRSRPGLAPSNPRAPLAQLGGLAAVIAPSKTADAIFDAMRGLSAYATSGQRIILDADLNGARMGTRQENADERQITCRVMGTSPIDHIDVVKNGEVVFSRHYATAPLDSHTRVLVGFESSSEVFGDGLDNPRGYRIWQGSVTVEGARVVDVEALGFENSYSETVEVDQKDTDLIRFRTETRGRRDTMLVELEEVSSDTVLGFHLEPSREYGARPPLVRSAADLPGADFRLRLSDLVKGRLDHALTVDAHTDRVTLQVVDPEGAMDREFSYADLGPHTPGDYYYLRVTQLDGGRAWSSPFWVGGREIDRGI
jgi:hypothetical protein